MPIPQRDLDEIGEIVDELSNVMRRHRLSLVVMTLSQTLALLWCSSKKFQTVTDALDCWRDELNPDMEKVIRRAFGDMRYPSRGNE
jgi:hypothetical protein